MTKPSASSSPAQSGTALAGANNAEFDEFAANYDEALNQGLKFTGEGKDFFAVGRVQWLARQLAGRGVKVEKVLDFGCGTGTGCGPLLDGLGLQAYVGYDPSADSIAEARRTHEEVAAQFEWQPERLAEGEFDLAFTNGVFHHIPLEYRTEAVGQVWRSLKPGGWFAFWENNRWNPMVHFIMSRVPFDRDAQMLFPHQARGLLRATGFSIALTDYLFVFPAALKALRWSEPALRKFPLGGQYMVLAQKPLSA
jgi:SAM-dependent methyltransferase